METRITTTGMLIPSASGRIEELLSSEIVVLVSVFVVRLVY